MQSYVSRTAVMLSHSASEQRITAAGQLVVFLVIRFKVVDWRFFVLAYSAELLNKVAWSQLTTQSLRFRIIRIPISDTTAGLGSKIFSQTSVNVQASTKTACEWPRSISFLARDVIYTSRAYATMSVSVCLSVCPSVCDGNELAHYS